MRTGTITGAIQAQSMKETERSKIQPSFLIMSCKQSKIAARPFPPLSAVLQILKKAWRSALASSYAREITKQKIDEGEADDEENEEANPALAKTLQFGL